MIGKLKQLMLREEARRVPVVVEVVAERQRIHVTHVVGHRNEAAVRRQVLRSAPVPLEQQCREGPHRRDHGSEGQIGASGHRLYSTVAPSAASLPRKSSYPRSMMPMPCTIDVPDAASAAMRCEKPPRRSGTVISAAVQRRRARDHGAVVEITLAKTALLVAKAFAEQLHLRAHGNERVGEPKALLVHRLVDDRQALRLGERHDERLLPVGHEARVHVGLYGDGTKLAARVVEPDALRHHLELAAHLAEHVEEHAHAALLRAEHHDVAAGGERRRGPRTHLDAVRERRVVVTVHAAHALDRHRAIRVDRDDRAHLLEGVDEVLDLGLNGGVLEAA